MVDQGSSASIGPFSFDLLRRQREAEEGQAIRTLFVRTEIPAPKRRCRIWASGVLADPVARVLERVPVPEDPPIGYFINRFLRRRQEGVDLD